MFEKILNIFFPNVCGFCNTINNNSLCENCEKMILKYKLNTIKDYRQDKTKYFDFCFCALKYKSIIRDKIIAYKFGEKAYLYKTFTKIIINNKKICRFLKLYDIIIPVPMFKSKQSVRGYNQSLLVAREISKQVGIKYLKDTLIKIKDTKIQSTLDKTSRLNNVKNAFRVQKKDIIKGKKIILLDDIYTTGSTVNECCKKLKQAGAKEILVITIARD